MRSTIGHCPQGSNVRAIPKLSDFRAMMGPGWRRESPHKCCRIHGKTRFFITSL